MEAFSKAALFLVCFINDSARPCELPSGNIPPDLRDRSRQLGREGVPADNGSQFVWHDWSVFIGCINVSKINVASLCSLLILPSKRCGWRSFATFTQHVGLHVCCSSTLGPRQGLLDDGDPRNLVWSFLFQLCRSKKPHGSSRGGQFEPSK